MKQSEMPLGSVITLGQPANRRLAAKGANGWRLLDTGELVDPEEFRGGWDDYSPIQPDEGGEQLGQAIRTRCH